jgi:two-component system sensor histidine kinase GlrK
MSAALPPDQASEHAAPSGSSAPSPEAVPPAGRSTVSRLLQRFSFRQLLVLAFLLVAALLGAASLRALFTLEQLTLQSRDSAVAALAISAEAQSLAERSVSMERSSRQSVVLDDRVLRERFREEVSDTEKTVSSLAQAGVGREQVERWRAQMLGISELVTGPPDTALDRERLLAQEFRDLDRIHTAMAQAVRQALRLRNEALLNKLEDSRRRLTQQVSWAIALAVVMALTFGVWLTRPLKRLERAIVGLGQNRLDQPIAIEGPADLALVGERLNWLRLRLVELDADKARFLRHISHELKTPLASLREGVSLLEDGVVGELSAKQQEIVQILRANTGVLQSQIEDLLRFNAAGFEARQLHRQPVELLPLVEAQVEAQQLQWRARDLKVQIDTPTGTQGLRLEVDAEKLGVALANLLSNAIRFSPAGGLIRITLATAPGMVSIRMDDEGSGVAEADRTRIFEPFYRGERQPAGAVRGSGIGLSIVHEYIAAHGGRITLLPEQPGAHFKIDIPHAHAP